MSFHDQHIKIQTQLHIFDSSTNSFSCWCCLRSAGSGWSPLNQSEQLNIWRLEAMLNWAWVWYSSSNMALFLEQIHDGQPWYWSLIRERQDMTRSYLCIWLMSSDAGDMSHNVGWLLLPTSHWSHACYVHTAIIKFCFYYCLTYTDLHCWKHHCLLPESTGSGITGSSMSGVVGSLCPKNPEVS